MFVIKTYSYILDNIYICYICIYINLFSHKKGVRNIIKMKAGGLEVGPILMGMKNKAHIVTPSITARGLLNMAAIAGTQAVVGNHGRAFLELEASDRHKRR